MKPTPHYHHGNLRQALLDASLDLIQKVGPEGFTLREVARLAGVSHNAPYRHFRDKSELLAAVTAEGFDRLTEAMTQAASTVEPAINKLRLCGRGYVEFALRNPPHFTVMFEASRPLQTFPEAYAAGERAFGTLVRCVEECQLEGSLPQGDPQPLALIAWSMVHGVAKLAIAGQFPFSQIDEILKFADAATLALFHGMANGKVPNRETCTRSETPAR